MFLLSWKVSTRHLLPVTSGKVADGLVLGSVTTVRPRAVKPCGRDSERTYDECDFMKGYV